MKSSAGKEAAGQDGCREGEPKEGLSVGPKQLDPQVIHSPGRTGESIASPDRG